MADLMNLIVLVNKKDKSQEEIALHYQALLDKAKGLNKDELLAIYPKIESTFVKSVLFRRIKRLEINNV